MTDADELLRRLGRLARQEQARPEAADPRWEALATGALAPEDESALARDAAASPAGAAAWEAYRPLGREFEERLVAAILAQAAPPVAAPAVAALPLPRPAATRRRPVVALARRWWLPAAALLAASLAIWVRPSRAPLPEYALAAHGAVRTQRGESPSPAGEALCLAAGNLLRIELAPVTAVEGRVEAIAYLAAGGEIRPLALATEVAASGAIRLAGEAGRELPASPSAADLLVAVGRPGRLPATRDLASGTAGGGPARGEGWMGWRLALSCQGAG